MKTYIQNVRIIDGLGNSIENGSVLFDDRILQISSSPLEGADSVIDGTGYTLIPGLIESHAHLAMDASMNPFAVIEKDSEAATGIKAYLDGLKFIESGITTIRNMGTKYDVDIEYRNMVRSGMLKGPRVIASGMLLTMTGGHGHAIGIECDNPDEARKAARLQIKKGADVIKLIATGGVLTPGSEIGAPQMSEEDMRAACQEAKRQGRTSAAHCIGVSGIKNAIRAGVTSVEHGYYVDDEAIELMLENQTYFVPTISAPLSMVRYGKDLDDEFVQTSIRKILPLAENHKIVFKKALAAGIKIAAGTDQGTPHNYPGGLVYELEKFIEYGMTNMQAITAATHTAAELVNLSDSIGSIETGKIADLVLLKGNPLEDIWNITKVAKVFQSGRMTVDQAG